jgi:hypothetical protein
MSVEYRLQLKTYIHLTFQQNCKKSSTYSLILQCTFVSQIYILVLACHTCTILHIPQTNHLWFETRIMENALRSGTICVDV